MAGETPFHSIQHTQCLMAMLIPIHVLLTQGRPEKSIICHDVEGVITWREFSANIAKLSASFRLRKELRWLISNEEPLGFLIELLALLHAGKEAVIPPNHQPGTIKRLAQGYDACTSDIEIVTQPSASFELLDPNTSIIHLYTSGSTGEPKLVSKSLAQLEAEVEMLEQSWGNRLNDITIIATVPHHHIYGLLFRLLWPLSSGRAFDNVTCTLPDTICQRLTLLGNSALVSSPAQLSRLPALIPLSSLQPQLKMIYSSGGPLSADVAQDFHQQLGEAPTEIFGSTETGGVAWRIQNNDDAWTPLPGIKVASDSDHALLLSSVLMGDNTVCRMEDAIELLPDMRFRLLGRLDRIVKIEEKRLSLPDMESLLSSHPWISSAGIVAISRQRQSIGAAIVLNDIGQQQLSTIGRREVSRQLRRHLAERFETVLLPRYWRFPTALPINARGKLTQTALAALFSENEDVHVSAT